MRLFGKILLIFCVVICLLSASVIVFVKIYFNDERVQNMLVENAAKMGIHISLKSAHLKLLHGINIRELTIYEGSQDGSSYLMNLEDLKISYSLGSLLKKKLIINEIFFNNPKIKVKYINGKWNYENLIPKNKEEKNKNDSASMPEFNVVINDFEIRNAQIEADYEKNNLILKNIDIKANGDLLSLKNNLYIELKKFKINSDLASATGSANISNDFAVNIKDVSLSSEIFKPFGLNYFSSITVEYLNANLKAKSQLPQIETKLIINNVKYKAQSYSFSSDAIIIPIKLKDKTLNVEVVVKEIGSVLKLKMFLKNIKTPIDVSGEVFASIDGKKLSICYEGLNISGILDFNSKYSYSKNKVKLDGLIVLDNINISTKDGSLLVEAANGSFPIKQDFIYNKNIIYPETKKPFNMPQGVYSDNPVTKFKIKKAKNNDILIENIAFNAELINNYFNLSALSLNVLDGELRGNMYVQLTNEQNVIFMLDSTFSKINISKLMKDSVTNSALINGDIKFNLDYKGRALDLNLDITKIGNDTLSELLKYAQNQVEDKESIRNIRKNLSLADTKPERVRVWTQYGYLNVDVILKKNLNPVAMIVGSNISNNQIRRISIEPILNKVLPK